MEFDQILETAAGREAADEIQRQMKAQGIYLTARENADLRFDKMKTQRDDLIREREALAGQLARERADFTQQLQDRQKSLDRASRRLADRCISEEIARMKPKNAAVVQALVTAGGIPEPDETGMFPEISQKLAELMHNEPYLFEAPYEPQGGTETSDPAALSDAEYFSRMKSRENS